MSRSATGNILKDGREQSKRSKRSTSPRFEVGLPPIASTVWSEPDADRYREFDPYPDCLGVEAYGTSGPLFWGMDQAKKKHKVLIMGLIKKIDNQLSPCDTRVSPF